MVLTALSMLLPLLIGWSLVRRLWADAPIGLRVGLAATAGTSLIGTLYFCALLLSDSPQLSLIAAELIGGAIAVLLWIGGSVSPGKPTVEFFGQGHAWIGTCTAIIAGGAFFLALDSLRHGGWDAFVMWNLRGRLIATSTVSPLSALFDPTFLGLHPDYPLLLPSLLARGWQYAGPDTLAVPIGLAALFTVATIMITVSGLRVLSTNAQAWIAGSILLGTPFLLSHGASQYADIVVSCFMTAAVVLYCVYDSDPSRHRLPLLAGIMVAAAACTKNEGILLLIAVVLARVTVAVLGKPVKYAWRELWMFGSGASLGLITLAVFKLWHAPPNDTVPITAVHELVARITDGHRHLFVLSGIRNSLNFGQWPLNPMPLMAIYAAVTWKVFPASRAGRVVPWFTPAFVIVAMICGVYAVNLLSPYDVESHLESSFDRILLQLWPSIVILYSLISAPRGSTTSSWTLSPASARRAALTVFMLAAIAVSSMSENPSDRSERTKPRIELSRNEVVTGESYAMKITGIAGPQVYVSYALDGKPMGQIGAYIGTDGTVDFQVSPSTPRGTYQFLAVRPMDNSEWIDFENNATILVK